jgi:ABC-type transport system involved in multi-copper enzyme maturation permease subunit
MTAVVTPHTRAVQPTYRAAGFADVLRSEWTKVRSVPSTLWTLLVAAVLGIGLSALFTGLAANSYKTGSHDVRTNWDPTSVSTSGLAIAQLAIGVLGALVISSEYSTHAIRTSLTAVPRRGRFLSAKATVIAVVAFVIGEIMAFTAFFIGQALISGNAPTVGLGDPHVLRAVFGSGLYLTVIGLLGVGLGAFLRSAAGAITALVAMVYVLPGLAHALPSSMQNNIDKFWPTNAGQQITSVVRLDHTLPAWGGFAVMCLFVAIVLAAAFTRLQRRDA